MGFFDIFKKKKKMSDGLEKTRTDFFQNIVNTLTSSVIDDDPVSYTHLTLPTT